MASINSRSGKLVVDFRYQGKRCRETTAFKDNAANRRKLAAIVERLEAEITLGTFKYEEYFPNSARGKQLSYNAKLRAAANTSDAPSLEDFSELWFREREGEWRNTYRKNVRQTLDKYVLPLLGDYKTNELSKTDIMEFRSKLLVTKTSSNKQLGNDRINRIMGVLRMIINEAADRYEFTNPWMNIKQLKIGRSDIEPFTLEEIKKFLNGVRPDFRNYYTVRFFTGMRTGEIDGLFWEHVDFKNRLILVRQAIVDNEIVPTKTDGSFREISMSQMVYDALLAQKEVTRGKTNFVFCSPDGSNLRHGNVTKRIWYPTLEYLNIRKRNPYQTRHTAASLWLSAGENAEWIARQLGHSNTTMLFKIYSRYVPNLTRKDGSLFDKILEDKMINDVDKEDV